MSGINLSISSYRDPELLPTVVSALVNAKYPDALHFTIVSQAEDEEHPDLSFIPEEQLTYHKIHWSQSKGACWAREIGSRYIPSAFFLQTDSHSRFKQDWDKIIVDSYLESRKHYGDIVFTTYPEGYKVKEDGEDELHYRDTPLKIVPVWNDGEKMVGPSFHTASSNPFGDEVYYLSANSLFCFRELIYRVPYDPFLYFYGEEPSLGLRFYTRNIKLINTPVNFMFHEYKASWEGPKRKLHWEDNQEWHKLNYQSYDRLAKIMTGDKSLGVYSIGDEDLYLEWISRTGVELRDKYDVIMSKVK